MRAQAFHTNAQQRPNRCSRSTVVCRAALPGDRQSFGQALKHTLQVGALAVATGLLATGAAHAEFRLPPIDNDPKRCERGFIGNTIGQANAVSDKLLDLRKCSFKGADLTAKVLSGALLEDADMSGSNLTEAVMSKAYAVDANFSGSNFGSAVLDRVDFSRSNLSGASFINAVVTGVIFQDANLADTVWEDALVGGEDVKRLCKNPTLVGESRLQVGCRQ